MSASTPAWSLPVAWAKRNSAEERAIVGVTPNVAARLQAIAKPGRIVISGATRKRIEAGYHTESLGQVKLRGLKEPIEAFVVGAEKPVVDARGVGAAGREAELAALDRLWSGLSAGSFVRASLIGVPGIGKSTVVRTFLARLSKGKGGAVAFFVNGIEFDRHSAFRALHRMAVRESGEAQPGSPAQGCRTGIVRSASAVQQQDRGGRRRPDRRYHAHSQGLPGDHGRSGHSSLSRIGSGSTAPPAG